MGSARGRESLEGPSRSPLFLLDRILPLSFLSLPSSLIFMLVVGQFQHLGHYWKKKIP